MKPEITNHTGSPLSCGDTYERIILFFYVRDKTSLLGPQFLNYPANPSPTDRQRDRQTERVNVRTVFDLVTAVKSGPWECLESIDQLFFVVFGLVSCLGESETTGSFRDVYCYQYSASVVVSILSLVRVRGF